MKNVYQKLFLVSGFICVGLAIIGILLPIMPTVPFLLLAAACFDKSSPRFHHALVSHVHFGPLIRDFYAGKGIPRRAKLISLTMIWGSCVISLFIVPFLWVKLTLVAIFTAVTVYLVKLKNSDQAVFQEEPVQPEEES